MGRLSLAWRILTNGDLAERVQRLLTQEALPQPAEKREPVPVPSPVPKQAPAPARSEALTLLSALQREGRLVDFLKEPLESYSDAQVGAAVRDIHRDCGAMLERQFGIRPVVEQPEGSEVSPGPRPDPGKYKLSGQVGDQSMVSGRLVHHGWRVTQCQLPQWSGSAETAFIIAPAEVELKKS